jgi:hypothetical protein
MPDIQPDLGGSRATGVGTQPRLQASGNGGSFTNPAVGLERPQTGIEKTGIYNG